MNKRAFLKLFGATLASPAVMRLLAWAGQERLRNWAGNIEYSTDEVEAATSLDQVQSYIKSQTKLKVAVERLHEQVSPSLLITEIRTIAADHLWMSPCYEQDCVTIHFTWKPDWPAVSKLLPVIEKELAPFDARPHWGTLFTISPPELRRIYKKMPEFIELSKRYDPQGKFRNEFLNKNIFGDVAA